MAQDNRRLGLTWQSGQIGQLKEIADVAANDSDKTLTVPAGVVWEILWLHASLASTSTVGSRNMRLVIADDEAVTVGQVDADSTQAASATEFYHFGVYGAAIETPAGYHFAPMPHWVLPAGFTVRIYDSAAVAATADDLTVHMLVAEFSAN